MELVGAMNAIIIVIIVTDLIRCTGLPLQFVGNLILKDSLGPPPPPPFKSLRFEKCAI